MTGAGPLMNEPMYGVAFAVEKIEMGRKIAGAAVSDQDIRDLTGAGFEGVEWGLGGVPVEKGVMLSGEEEKGEKREGTVRFKDVEKGEKGRDGEKEREKERDKDKGGLLLGQLISDATEAFRLAFLSCPVHTHTHTNTHMHMHMDMDMDTYICTYTHSYTWTDLHTLSHTRTPTSSHKH
jgi:hypothetical protein